MVRQCIPLSAVAGSVYLNEEGHDIVERGDSPVPDVGSAVVWNVRGCTNLGIGVSAGGPVAILSGSRGDLPLGRMARGRAMRGARIRECVILTS